MSSIAGAARCGWSCSRRSAPRLRVTARRSTWPETAVPSVKRADDRHLGARAWREQRGKARDRRARASTSSRDASRARLVEIVAARARCCRAASARRSAGSAGSDCNSRCTMRPRASALRRRADVRRAPSRRQRGRDRARRGCSAGASRAQPVRQIVSRGARRGGCGRPRVVIRRRPCASASTVPSPSSAGSSIASGFSASLDQLVPAARPASCSRRASPQTTSRSAARVIAT